MEHPLTVATVLSRAGEALPAEWVWLARDPAAVRLCVYPSRRWAPPRPVPSRENAARCPAAGVALWCLARDRLRDAVAGGEPGPGHVVVRGWPDRLVLGVELWMGSAWWRGITDARVAERFLGESYAHVSAEREGVLLAAAAGRLDPGRLAELEDETS